MPKQEVGNIVGTYPLIVDYEMSVEQLIERGRYDSVNSGITSTNFPTRQKGNKEVVVEIFDFSPRNSGTKALRELEGMDYRPVELHELLALGAMYPSFPPKELMVCAVGSTLSNSRNRILSVPCLGWYGWQRQERHVALLFWVELQVTRFAAVRK